MTPTDPRVAEPFADKVDIERSGTWCEGNRLLVHPIYSVQPDSAPKISALMSNCNASARETTGRSPLSDAGHEVSRRPAHDIDTLRSGGMPVRLLLVVSHDGWSLVEARALAAGIKEACVSIGLEVSESDRQPGIL